jgi:hypothetical protein
MECFWHSVLASLGFRAMWWWRWMDSYIDGTDGEREESPSHEIEIGREAVTESYPPPCLRLIR